jgi:hypothetical protein
LKLTGQLNFKCDNSDNNTKSGNLIYSSTSTSTTSTPVTQQNKNYVDVSYSETPSNPPNYSSDPQLE